MSRHLIVKMCQAHLHQWWLFWLKYKRNRVAVAGIIVTFFFAGIGILAPIFAPYDPLRTGAKALLTPTLTWNGREHIMGTDNLGRDILSGVLFGVRTSILIGCLAVAISLIIGIPMGALSGYFGGRIDDILMRVTELFLVIPKFFLALICVVLFGATIWNIVLVIGILTWPATARLVRGQFLSLREEQFVQASHALGASDRTVIFREILPNAMSPVIVNSSLEVASAILIEAGLSFLGLGDPTVMSLGYMIYNAQRYLAMAWWLALFPGLALSVLVLALNLMGDGLNEALNPKLMERRM